MEFGHTFAICENKKIYCWGRNYDGQLGLGDNKNRNEPVEFKIEENSSPIKQIICGAYHTFAICENNKIYCWGNNNFGQLGLGRIKMLGFRFRYKTAPIEFKIEGNSSPIKQIICGANHIFAICENNKIYCWGYNHSGQLGLGDYES